MALALDLSLLLGAYLLGSIPFGVILGYFVLGKDIRASGSGHSGATNTLRQAGWKAGAVVAVLDVLKGFGAEWLALRYGSGPLVWILAAAFVVAGHCWPVFVKFRGGMGIGTIGGVMFAAYPLGAFLGLALVAFGTLISRHAARSNVISGLLFGPVVGWFSGDLTLGLIAGAASLSLSIRSLSDWNRVYKEVWLDREKKEEE